MFLTFPVSKKIITWSAVLWRNFSGISVKLAAYTLVSRAEKYQSGGDQQRTFRRPRKRNQIWAQLGYALYGRG
jgi:hypothetical protein